MTSERSGGVRSGTLAGEARVLPPPAGRRFCPRILRGHILSGRNVGCNHQPRRRLETDLDGFSLVEILVSLCILTFGLLATAQIVFVSLTSTTLSRSKSLAAFAAQSQLESLAELFSRNPDAGELADGNHGPRTVEVANPGEGTVLNRFSVGWTVSGVTDPRPGRELNARQVTVTVTPIDVGGSPQPKALFNKVVSISVILSARLP
jgi:Tfp pilus assembly protein PilV